jgi:uncharacterized coiled-coil DUF342 family protein
VKIGDFLSEEDVSKIEEAELLFEQEDGHHTVVELIKLAEMKRKASNAKNARIRLRGKIAKLSSDGDALVCFASKHHPNISLHFECAASAVKPASTTKQQEDTELPKTIEQLHHDMMNASSAVARYVKKLNKLKRDEVYFIDFVKKNYLNVCYSNTRAIEKVAAATSSCAIKVMSGSESDAN